MKAEISRETGDVVNPAMILCDEVGCTCEAGHPGPHQMAPNLEPSKWHRINYVCTKCGATDSDQIYDGGNPFQALNCWKCGAGRGMDLVTMLETRTGMMLEVVA